MPPRPDHDDKKWEYQAHTKAKHEILRYYLTNWTRIVSNEDYDLRMFDCFAGRGRYEGASDGTEPYNLKTIESSVEYPGSPQIMLDVLSEHDHLFKGADLILIEPNETNREILRDSIRNCSNVSEDVEVHFKEGKFQDKAKEALRDTGGKRGFAFFLMDPFGIKPLEYDLVSDICSTDRFDTLITLMTKELIRWQDSEKHEDSFETLYGTPSWKRNLQQYQANNLHDKEAEYYSHRLEEAGVENTLAYMTTKGNDRSLMYHLVFTTNDEKGMDAMKESMLRCGTAYTLAYAPERGEVHGGQTGLNHWGTGDGEYLSEKESAKSYMLTQFAGEIMSFQDVVTKLAAKRPRESLLRKDYREIVQEMHDSGLIDIPQRDRPGGNLREGYTILFPDQNGAE